MESNQSVSAHSDTHVACEYRSFISGSSVASINSWLEEATEAISAHLNDRYALQLKDGKAHLTFNEIMGIVANAHERSSMRGYIGPIHVGDRFQWDPLGDIASVIEVTKIDTDLKLVWTMLIAGDGPKTEVFNTEAKFRKFCTKL